MDPDHAASIVQSCMRRFLAKKAVAKKCERIYGRFYDSASGYDYYIDFRSGQSYWEIPKVLGGFGLEYHEYLQQDEDYYNEVKESKEDFVEEEESWILDEYPPAQVPSTSKTIYNAWRQIMPEEENPNNAKLFRVDVYTSNSPQRCCIVKSSDLVGVLREHEAYTKEELDTLGNEHEEWTYSLSFFAFDAKVPGSTRYTVWTNPRPYRSSISIEVEDEEPPLTKVARDNSDWIRRFDFWAYYSPVQQAIRLNVQQVLNPMRFRVTEDRPKRGGWKQMLCFFAYPTVRLATLDSVGCPKHMVRSKFSVFSDTSYKEIHPPVYGLDIEEKNGIRQEWCRRFEFVGFKSRFPGTMRYTVLEKKSPMRSLEENIIWKRETDIFNMQSNSPEQRREYKSAERDKAVYQISRIATENDVFTDEWELVSEFYAFSLPMPGTTRYYFMVNRNPTRYLLATTDFVGNSWKTLFVFYAYSTKHEDTYSWEKLGDNGVWTATAIF
mmetsp:Transcript_2115/g.4028  ORF Transcript_2115/g.4028 Transcript_2115/m.4028 type:complete len:494 (+) Transcript_2115:3955-5436(+)